VVRDDLFRLKFQLSNSYVSSVIVLFVCFAESIHIVHEFLLNRHGCEQVEEDGKFKLCRREFPIITPLLWFVI